MTTNYLCSFLQLVFIRDPFILSISLVPPTKFPKEKQRISTVDDIYSIIRYKILIDKQYYYSSYNYV